jgi:hypothetical protein
MPHYSQAEVTVGLLAARPVSTQGWIIITSTRQCLVLRLCAVFHTSTVLIFTPSFSAWELQSFDQPRLELASSAARSRLTGFPVPACLTQKGLVVVIVPFSHEHWKKRPH